MTSAVFAVEPRDLFTVDEPPPEVAADAARLAVWKATAGDRMSVYDDLSVIGVNGCGIRQTYVCWDQRAPHGDDRDSFCEEIDLTDPHVTLGSFTLNRNVAQTLSDQLANRSSD